MVTVAMGREDEFEGLVGNDFLDPNCYSVACLIVNGGSTRIASFSPELCVDAMCDHVSWIPNGKGPAGTKGIMSVT